MINQNNATQPVLTDLELLAVGAKHGRPSVALLPMWRAVESAVLSKLCPTGAGIRIGVSATGQGATVCVMRQHADGTATVIYSDAHPLGDSAGRAALAIVPADQEAITLAARDVLAERQRQISAEGWAPEHDDKNTAEQLALAAVCYALPQGDYTIPEPPEFWPWDVAWWKPGDRRRELIKAGALVLAEIERLDRAARQGKGGK